MPRIYDDEVKRRAADVPYVKGMDDPNLAPKRAPETTSAYNLGKNIKKTAGSMVRGLTRPFIEPLIEQAPKVGARVGGAAMDFGRGIVGAAPPSIPGYQHAGAGIPAAEARSTATQRGTRADARPPAPPASAPPTTRAPAYDVQPNYHGIQGISRVTNRDMPNEAPLFTNNPSAAAAYNEMGGPGLTPANGNPDVRAASGNPVGYGGPVEGPARYLNSKGQYVGPLKDPGVLPPRTDGGPETLSREDVPYTRGNSLANVARTTKEWDAWDKQGEPIPGKTGTFSVAPGLFSGVSAETEQALSEARTAAGNRGDFEAVERSYLTTPRAARRIRRRKR